MAKRDLFLMAQSGPVGRAQANKVLWKTLPGPALEPDYPDLSNMVAHEVYKARKTFDRPLARILTSSGGPGAPTHSWPRRT